MDRGVLTVGESVVEAVRDPQRGLVILREANLPAWRQQQRQQLQPLAQLAPFPGSGSPASSFAYCLYPPRLGALGRRQPAPQLLGLLRLPAPYTRRRPLPRALPTPLLRVDQRPTTACACLGST